MVLETTENPGSHGADVIEIVPVEFGHVPWPLWDPSFWVATVWVSVEMVALA